jgi:hypothetical protein
LAWLAVVAVLINALVPTAISAASASGASIAANSAFCGAVSGGTGPAKQSTPAAHRCICCLAGAVGGFLPAPPSAPLPREHAAAFIEKFSTDAATATHFAYGAARPRGPPITG